MSSTTGRWRLASPAAALLALAACGDGAGPVTSGDELPDGYVEGLASEDNEYEKPLLPGEKPLGKADGFVGPAELPVSVDGGATAVWTVRNAWTDTDTAAARAAGVAWGASSGLTWEEKYRRWVASLPRHAAHSGSYDTFALTTPDGKTLPGPALECAEAALFLRAAFASWYALPFMISGGVGSGRLVFGHFGALKADGTAFGPRYRDLYRDHTPRDGRTPARWPSDTRLRAKRLGGSQDDFQPFLGASARAGAYFDEVFLNKRVGHFMLLLLSYFGSINLASAANTFNLTPESVAPGDVLLERWQRQGIGHALVVKAVTPLDAGRLDAELVSGSMPRRQPKWEDALDSRSTFTSGYTGGSEQSDEPGLSYAALGGGLKRFRAAQVQGGRWRNVVPAADQSAFIAEGDLDRIGARPARFATLLGDVSPAEKQVALQGRIEEQRQHLREHPASCSARQRREEAFGELYALGRDHLGIAAAELDRQHRRLEDYVFAPLVYARSKTCCWNSTTAAMYALVMEYNRALMADATARGTCVQPVVFKEENGDYAVFREYAASAGRAAEWRAWTEDEPCAQRANTSGALAPFAAAPFCDVAAQVLATEGIGGDGGGGSDACTDAFAGNDARARAASVGAGRHAGLEVCSGVEDWFVVQAAAGARVSVTIDFSHAAGDLDLALQDAAGGALERSAGTSDRERVTTTATGGALYAQVVGYGSAAGSYDLTVTIEAAGGGGGGAACSDRFAANRTQATAATPGAGTFEALHLCAGEEDWFRVDAPAGAAVTFGIAFRHADGDLDLARHDASGASVAVSNSTSDGESLTATSQGTALYFRVHGYNGATNVYRLDVRY